MRFAYCALRTATRAAFLCADLDLAPGHVEDHAAYVA
jgi:hypothetical protein